MRAPSRSPWRLAPRFSLRGLLVLLVLCGLLFAWHRDHQKQATELRRTKAVLKALVRTDEMDDQPNWALSFTGNSFNFRPSRTTYTSPKEFIAALREADDWDRFDVLQVNFFVNSELADDAIEPLIALLDDSDEEIRKRAVHVLWKYGLLSRDEKQRARRAAQIAPALATVLARDEASVRSVAIKALTDFNEHARAALPALRAEMENREPHEAVRAAHAMWRIGKSSEVEPFLISMLHADDVGTRHSAILGLAEIGSPRAKAALADAFMNEPSGEIHDRLATALAALEKEGR